jgi:regulator of sirC expression with transglutaminase-like and TPR domain
MRPQFVDYRYVARRRLAERISDRARFDLVEAALLVAAEEDPDLEMEREVRRVHLIAAEGARRSLGLSNPFARLDALQTHLFEILGFKGNNDSYDDPKNSYLHEVLNRRLGNPLSLSILFLEVARAAGFEARGIALAGHFIASVTLGGRTILVDPFHHGRVICQDDCRDLVARTTGRPDLFRPEVLRGTDERGMLRRMLMNLKRIFVKSRDYPRSLSVVERLLLLDPDSPSELRDRGFLHAHLGRTDAALSDFQSYLALVPRAPDAERVRGRMDWLRRRLSEAN